MASARKIFGRTPGRNVAKKREVGDHAMVGITKALEPSGEPSGQRWVTFLFLVQNLKSLGAILVDVAEA